MFKRIKKRYVIFAVLAVVAVGLLLNYQAIYCREKIDVGSRSKLVGYSKESAVKLLAEGGDGIVNSQSGINVVKHTSALCKNPVKGDSNSRWVQYAADIAVLQDGAELSDAANAGDYIFLEVKIGSTVNHIGFLEKCKSVSYKNGVLRMTWYVDAKMASETVAPSVGPIFPYPVPVGGEASFPYPFDEQSSAYIFMIEKASFEGEIESVVIDMIDVSLFGN